MRLFNTASGRAEVIPAKDEYRMYVCGITPYDAAHLGHVFTFMTYDLIQRRLQDEGGRVRVVRNITDVDDPMYVKAAELGIHYMDLAKQEISTFQEVMAQLNLIPPDVEPRPSEHIDAIAESVGHLLASGHAYRLDGGDVYFDVSTDAGFGQLSGYSPRLLRGLAASRGGDPDRTGKRQPLDFLLWKTIANTDDPAAWQTPLGLGRPGWHIECSVMAAAHLGPFVDIHGGGSDLVFPHHECERAQSEALGHTPFVGAWVHTAPLGMGGEKMSKSLGNLVFAADLLADSEPAAVRLALMSYHYRRGGEWHADALTQGEHLLASIREALRRPSGHDPRPLLAQLRADLDDDLDAPAALRTLRRATQGLLLGGSSPDAADGLREMLALLGLEVAG